MNKIKFKGQNAVSGKWVYGVGILKDRNSTVIVTQDGAKHHVLIDTIKEVGEEQNECV